MYNNPIDYINTISVDSSTSCPIVPWFKFKGPCNIASCKAYAKNSKYGCIYIDTGKHHISDLNISKVAKLKGVTTTELSETKRKAVLNVKSITQLYLYINYIIDKYKYEPAKHYTLDITDKVQEILNKTPLMSKEINFESWMLNLIVDRNVYSEFLLSSHIGKSKIKLNFILKLTPKEFTTLVSLIGTKSLF